MMELSTKKMELGIDIFPIYQSQLYRSIPNFEDIHTEYLFQLTMKQTNQTISQTRELIDEIKSGKDLSSFDIQDEVTDLLSLNKKAELLNYLILHHYSFSIVNDIVHMPIKGVW